VQFPENGSYGARPNPHARNVRLKAITPIPLFNVASVWITSTMASMVSTPSKLQTLITSSSGGRFEQKLGLPHSIFHEESESALTKRPLQGLRRRHLGNARQSWPCGGHTKGRHVTRVRAQMCDIVRALQRTNPGGATPRRARDPWVGCLGCKFR